MSRQLKAVADSPVYCSGSAVINLDNVRQELKIATKDLCHTIGIYINRSKVYNNSRLSSRLYSLVMDEMNKLLLGVSSREIENQIQEVIRRPIPSKHSIRDYYPLELLLLYKQLCVTTVNIMEKNNMLHPVSAVHYAFTLVVDNEYTPKPFVVHIPSSKVFQ